MSNAVTKGLGRLATLVLWGGVAVLGFLYLSAVPRTGHRTAVPVPVAPAETPTPAVAVPVAALPVPTPLERVEPAVPANPVMGLGSAPVPPEAPAAVAPVEVQTAPAPVPAPDAATSERPALPPVPAATVPAVQPGVPGAAGRPDGAQEGLRERRARVLSEYEAMRRAAMEEEMRQRWQGMGAPAPAGAPYGYPPQVPGYGPGPYAPPR